MGKYKSSQLSVVRNTLDKSLLISHSAKPIRYSIYDNQLYSMMPLIPDWDNLHKGFLATEKREVVIEFKAFSNFVLSNLENENTGIIFGDRIWQSARDASKLFNLLQVTLRDLVVTKRLKSLDDCRKALDEYFFEEVLDTLEINSVRRGLKNLWSYFLINTALLNIKSVILSGEASKKDFKTIPIKFIPKLGSELELISFEATITFDILVNRIFKQPFTTSAGKNVLFGSVHNGDIPDIEINRTQYPNLSPKAYPFEESGKRGYSVQRFDNAVTNALKCLSTEVEISFYEKYMQEMEQLVDALANLSTVLDHENADLGKLILVDFDFNENYDFKCNF